MTQQIKVNFQKKVSISTQINGVIVNTEHVSYKKFVTMGLESFQLACVEKSLIEKRFNLLEEAGYVITPCLSRWQSLFKWDVAKWV